MKVNLIAHTQLSQKYFDQIKDLSHNTASDGQIVSLMAIRSCYSYKTAQEVLETEFDKYFGDGGKDGKRLFNQIVKSGHTSTLEGIHFTFAVEGVSRALLAQLTRHRQLSFSVQSQRYNKFSSDSRSGGFDYVMPENVKKTLDDQYYTAYDVFEDVMEYIQKAYDDLIERGVPQEDARAILPNAAACNLVVSGNLRSWLEFYGKRKPGNGAQKEISEFAEKIKDEIVSVEKWTKDYFELD